ncbi:MAG TPA: 50S ribosomal protein L15 [Actinomycetota bacterium]|nr:50S ribosomal protein L15 [Actinomycetota bacterium]
MKLHHLRPAPGATRPRKRVGRGRAAGQGKTAGRGTKGYKARHQPKLGFEGGQMPLQRRVPKLKGFRNPKRVEYAVVNVEALARAFEGGEVDPAAMAARGLVREGLPVKVLARGDIGHALVVRAHAFSAQARAKIEQAGGRAEVLGSPG